MERLPATPHPAQSAGPAQPAIQIWRQGVANTRGAAPPAPRRAAAPLPPSRGRPGHDITSAAPDAGRRAQPNTKWRRPRPHPPPNSPEEEAAQSTQPETAEDGQTLFDDELDELLPVGTVASVMRAAVPPGRRSTPRTVRRSSWPSWRPRLLRVPGVVAVESTFRGSEASDACAAAGRRIMTGRDVVDAVVRLGFDRQAAPLEAFLATCPEKKKRREQGQAS